MRKIAVILLGLLLCLLCSGGGQHVCAHPVGHAGSELSVDSGFSDELLCQHEYNSDLSLPYVLSEVMPVTTSVFSVRSVKVLERMGIKCGVVCGCNGSVHIIPEFQQQHLSAAGCAVDYYVYRLRRLII